MIRRECELFLGAVPARTGDSESLPRGNATEPGQVWAGIIVLSRRGETTGDHWLRDGGYFVDSSCRVITHCVGIARRGGAQWMFDTYEMLWSSNRRWAMPVVAITYDEKLNCINGLHAIAEDDLAALGPTPRAR